MHSHLSLPTPLDAATQTKRKKNFMDRCVNKVRLCWWFKHLASCECARRVCKNSDSNWTLVLYESYKVQKCAQSCKYFVYAINKLCDQISLYREYAFLIFFKINYGLRLKLICYELYFWISILLVIPFSIPVNLNVNCGNFSVI